MGMKVATINVNGLHRKEKRSLFFRWCRRECLDIVLLQETHCYDPQNAQDWTREWGRPAFWSTSINPTAGVAFLLSKRAAALPHRIDILNPRLASLVIDVNGEPTTIINLYAPVRYAGNAPFFDQLAKRDWDTSRPSIIGGDFNSVLNMTFDRPGQTSRQASATGLASLIETLGVEDLWRKKNPSSKVVTRRNISGPGGSRIDRIYTPPSLEPWIDGPDHVISVFSDHDAVVLTINSPNASRSAFWKLNTTSLQDHQCRDLVKTIIEEVSDMPHTSCGDLWDRLKSDLRTALKRYSTHKAGLLKERATSIQEEIKRKEANPQITPEDRTYTEKLRGELKEYEERKLKGAQIRSRAAWQLSREAPTRLFSGLEKGRKQASHIASLKDADGSVLEDRRQMHERVRGFYQDLYTSAPMDPEARTKLLNTVQPALDAAATLSCEGLLTLEELTKAAKQLPSNRSPGPDGIPAEFYREFWPELGPLLLRATNEAFEAGLLPTSQRTGYITLIPKKGDLQDLSNWRPITLLTADYKIVSKAVYNRLAAVAQKVISPHQAAIPGRYIHTQTRLVQDIIDWATPTERDGGILFLDQTKAFDRVDWTFLDSVLAKKGFGPDFLRWVRALRSQGCSRVIVNGSLTRPFALTRGVRQGDPLSPLLFCVVIDALAEAISGDPCTEGFALPGTPRPQPAKAILYADDTALPFASAEDLSRIVQWLRVYESASGALVNIQKSAGMVFTGDPERFRPQFDAPWQPSTAPVTYLGVQVGRNLDLDDMWRPIADKVESALKLWANHHFSLAGIRTVVNTFALSKVWYTAAFAPLPLKTATRLTKLIYAYARKGKRSGAVASKWFHTPPNQGGLGLLDPSEMARTILTRMARRLINDPGSAWTRLPWEFVIMEAGYLGHGRATLFCENASPPLTPLSPFWSAVVKATRALARLPAISSLSPIETLSLPLWGNPRVLWKGAPLNPVSWQDLILFSSVRHVFQLFHADGSPKNFSELLKTMSPSLPFHSRMMVRALAQLALEFVPFVQGYMVPLSRRETALCFDSPPQAWFDWRSSPTPAPPPRYGFTLAEWSRLLKSARPQVTALKWNDTFLRVLHGTMPCFNNGQPCPNCGGSAPTPQHLFLECRIAREALDLLDNRLRSVGAAPLSKSSWTAFLVQRQPASPRKTSRRKRDFRLVAQRAMIHALWVFACQARDQQRTDLPSLLRAILERHCQAMGTVRAYRHLLLL